MRCILTVSLLLLLSVPGCSARTGSSDQIPPGTTDYVAVFGDSRDNNQIFSYLLRSALWNRRPSAVVHLGDMISSPSSFGQWPVFANIVRSFSVRDIFLPVVGNHDVDSADSLEIFRTVFPEVPASGYYTHKVGPCFALFLNTEESDTEAGTVSATQLDWARSTLAGNDAQSAQCRIVLTHRPVFPQNHHKGKDLQPSAELVALFQDEKVNLVLSGHEHSYSHIEKDGIHYVVSGGAGSPLFLDAGPEAAFFHYLQLAFTDTSINVRAIEISGKVRDEFNVSF
jgi:predicted phosphodiesterase